MRAGPHFYSYKMDNQDRPLGKKSSGAQFAKARRARELAERLEAGEDGGVAEYAKLGPPPLEDPEAAMIWMRKAQLVGLQLLLQDPKLSSREKFRAVKEMSEAVGKTHNRAAMERRVKDLEVKLDGTKKQQGAIKIEKVSDLLRPSTARGGASARGPRAVPPDLPDPEKGEG